MKLNDNLLNQKISSNIRLFIPTSEYSINYLPVLNQKDKPLYYKKPFFDTYWIEHVNYDPSYYSHFTFVMNRDHTLWIEANLYLIHLIQDDTAYNEDQRVPSKTIQEHSQALQKYKLFCDERDDELDLIYERNPSIREEMPFWKVAKRPFSRPNIKYRDYLQERVNKQEIKPRYAKKLLYPITSFYKFVNDYFGNNFLHLGKGISMPGKVDAAFIPINNNKGLIVETNEGNKIRGTYNKDVGYINDGGNTKPLTQEHQIQLFELLNSQGQPEIMISFLFSIFTAARMDTTFTLRLQHFINELPKNFSTESLNIWHKYNKQFVPNELYYIPIGEGSLIDAKGLEKRYNLQVPGWLMNIVQSYIISKRATQRRLNIKYPQENELDEYVFITQNFNPYYIAKSDPNKELYKNMSNGGSIRVYITNNISKKVKFKFKFHYLRATCLMNLNIRMEQESKLSLNERMKILKDFAGHTDEKTTQQYLEYSQNESDRYSAYDSRGDKLFQWLSQSAFINQNSENLNVETI